MDDLTESFISFWKNIWKKYRVEFFLILLALLITIISLALYLNTLSDEKTNIIIDSQKTDSQSVTNSNIYVDLAGAVEKPDLYEITSGARLKDVLVKAGGLSSEADRQFFSRNFNLARILADQEKIYIPSTAEVANGLIQQIPSSQQINADNQSSSLININTANFEELDQLPGIGKVTAEKIIRERPYQTIEELLTKKIVSKSVYEKIKNLTSVN